MSQAKITVVKLEIQLLYGNIVPHIVFWLEMCINFGHFVVLNEIYVNKCPFNCVANDLVDDLILLGKSSFTPKLIPHHVEIENQASKTVLNQRFFHMLPKQMIRGVSQKEA